MEVWLAFIAELPEDRPLLSLLVDWDLRSVRAAARIERGRRRLLGAHILAPEGADSIQTTAIAIKAELSGRIEELGSLTETPVVLVCRTDKRSASAAALLHSAGFRDVVVLRGGMVRWNEAGLPVVDRHSPTGA